MLLRNFYESIDIERSKGSKIQIARCLLEVVISFFLKFSNSIPKIINMFIIGIIIGTIRTGFYALFDFKKYSNTEYKEYIDYFIMFLESLKAVYGAFFNYTTGRLNKHYSSPSTRTLAQGIHMSIYKGLSSVLFAAYNLILIPIDDYSQNRNLTSDQFQAMFKILLFVNLIGLILAPGLAIFKYKDVKRLTDLFS